MDANPQTIKFDEQPPLDLVLRGIHSLYNDPKNENKERAGSWLTALQSSLYAWKVADELLLRKENIESCYFAAQTLRIKLQHSFAELPAEAYVSLKDSLLVHLSTIQENAIQTQLALCVTYLAILVPAWQNPVEELVSRDIGRLVQVEILTLLAEELDQSRKQNLIGVGANRRQQFTAYLTKIAPQIIRMLNSTVQEAALIQQTEQSITNASAAAPLPTTPASTSTQTGERLLAKVYRCLGAWMCLIDAEHVSLLEPLLSFMIDSLKDADTNDFVHDAAADTICGVAFQCENYARYHQLTHYLLNRVLELEQAYQRSVVSEEIDKSVNYSRIFTELAESIVEPLIVEPAYAIFNSSGTNVQLQLPGYKLVELLLACISHYDYEVAEITFHFWYRFSELVHKKGPTLLPLFAAVANRLLLGLIGHCRLECDQEVLLSTYSDLYEFRTRVRDLIKEVVFMVGVGEFVRENRLFEQLQIQLQQLRNGHADRGWEGVEAHLFILSCVTKELSETDDLMNQLLTLLLTTHDTRLHVQILATNCVILGELGEWLGKNTNYIQPVFNYLLAMITSQPPQPPPPPASSSNSSDSGDPTTLASVASSSLQLIVGSTSQLDVLAEGEFVNVLIDICSQLDHLFDETAAFNLLQCCATIITNIGYQSKENNPSPSQHSNTFENQQKLVVRLLKPSVDALETVFSCQTNSRNSSIYLDRIKAVLINLKFEEQMQRESELNNLIENRLWPLLLTQMMTADNYKIVEKSCKIVRCFVRCLRPVWLLKPIATSIVNLYQANPSRSPYLYLASVLVDQFSDDCDENTINGLVSMLNALSLPTFQLLTAPNTLLREHPLTIDDFFRLSNRFLRKAPMHVLNGSTFESIFDLAVACLALEHREANKSVARFVIEMFIKDPEMPAGSSVNELKRKALLHNSLGQRFLQAAIINALFRLSSYYIPEMSDLVYHVVRWDSKLAGEWLRAILSQLPTHFTPGLPVLESTQLDDFYKGVMEANSPKLVASSLRYLSRLLR